ncbi:DUF3857 domain-containing protein [Aureibacter tunicatorum]|uniref:Transglutaminase-like putative cysteine protease n=1 Tax=Aureibacter tunicatorum TaxID=866807 RepID=A0AAE3XRP0_9BACT|nr:DUF3857 domain-containing protein [Aureibacter tunicatorum]MDR6241372.1 transglutaminase-like putative cysteine protease [Aureibacter tunicatorum]BDD06783.1 hypothetical protein AUTU_42660 [Aureibacter tunicatorum]
MIHFYRVLIFLFFLGVSFNSFSNKPNWAIETSYAKPLTASEQQNFGDVYYLLINSQYNISLSEYYFKSVLHIISEQGVQNYSRIDLEYDPSYQEIEWLEVSVIRNGKKLNKLDSDLIISLDVENQAERHLYNKSKTQSINLKDIRKGDVLIYSYLRKGDNPILKDKFNTKGQFNYSERIGKISRSIIYKNDRKFNTNYINPIKELQYSKTESNGYVIEKWEAENISPVYYEDGTPSWHNVNTAIEISEDNDWGDVRLWAFDLFDQEIDQKRVSAELQKIIKDGQTENEKITAIIRFVQDDIRYLGFEDGIHAYLPHNPAEILDQRFGDCKDKSLLLVTMLKAIGVEAYPVLVNTIALKGLINKLPSRRAFNHCIVQIKNNGTFWIDPTLKLQGGDYRSMFWPNYEYGLVINSDDTKLTEISPNTNSSITTNEYLTVGKPEESSEFKIETLYYGEAADTQRNYIQSTSKSKMTQNYNDFYASKFNAIDREATKITVEDNREDNIVKIIEEYTISDLWKSLNDSSNVHTFRIGPYSMAGSITYPETKDRKSPYWILYPTNLTHHIWLQMPHQWSLSQDNIKYYSNSLNSYYLSEYISNSNTIHLNYKYKTNNNYVPLEEIADFINYHNQLDAIFEMEVNTHEEKNPFIKAKNSFNWGYPFLVIFFVISVWLMLYWNKHYDPISKEDDERFFRENIGGWLILPGIVILISPIINVFTLLNIEYLESDIWGVVLQMLKENNIYYDLWISIMFLEFFFSVFMFCASILIAYQFIAKRTSFPINYSGVLVINFVVRTLIYMSLVYIQGNVSSYDIATNPSSIIFQLILLCIWIPIIIFSNRVQETFVKRRKKDSVMKSDAKQLID